MKKTFFILCCALMLVVSGCSDNNNNSSSETPSSIFGANSGVSSDVQGGSSADDTQSSVEAPTQEPTNAVFDVTQAYANKPYTDEFALKRVDDLQYLNDVSLYNLRSDKESPEFYNGFFYEKSDFNVTMDTYNYAMDNETIRKYFDKYEYSKYASIGALKVIDSFVYNDIQNDVSIYYCYYTFTHWGEGEALDTLDYYRDVITVDHKTKEISGPEKVAIVTGFEMPKSVTGYHDFHGVI